MDGTGPEKQGEKTGRKLGNCLTEDEKNIALYGKGMGKRRNSGGGSGMGKRLKYDTNKKEVAAKQSDYKA
jgi:hypothetical protein